MKAPGHEDRVAAADRILRQVHEDMELASARQNRRNTMTNLTSPIVAIGTKYQDAARAPMGRLAQIAQEEETAYRQKFGALADGVSRPVMRSAPGTVKERADLRRQLSILAQAAQAEARKHQESATNGLVAARLAEYGDDAGRMADLLAAEQLSRTLHPDRLETEFWQVLNAGDVRAAAIRLRAVKVSKDAPKASVISRMESELEAMNDQAIPERAAALATWTEANKLSFELDLAALAFERDAAQMAGDPGAAAASNANAKVAAWMAGKREGFSA